MQSKHNEGKPVVAERVIKTLKYKIYKKIAANDSESDISYLNKLVDRYSNTYHHSIIKKPINGNFSALTGKIETNRIALDSLLKTNPWTYEIKDLNGEKINKNFLLKIIFAEYIVNELLSRTRQLYQR